MMKGLIASGLLGVILVLGLGIVGSLFIPILFMATSGDDANGGGEMCVSEEGLEFLLDGSYTAQNGMTKQNFSKAARAAVDHREMTGGNVNRDVLRYLDDYWYFATEAKETKNHGRIAIGEKYDINPILLFGIIMHETGWGTSYAWKQQNNTGGLMNGGTVIQFSSKRDSLVVHARTVRDLIHAHMGVNSHGAKPSKPFSLVELRNTYAPEGATNDPNGLNKYWVDGVTDVITSTLANYSGSYKKGKKQISNCDTGDFNIEKIGTHNMPLKSMVVTSRVQGGRIVNGEAPADHLGTDYACNEGDPVYATQDGVVFQSTWDDGWGNFTALHHKKSNLITLYAHMQKRPIVKNGQKVKGGQQVGYCGNTGHSFGAHLHLELRSGTPSGIGDYSKINRNSGNVLDFHDLVILKKDKK